MAFLYLLTLKNRCLYLYTIGIIVESFYTIILRILLQQVLSLLVSISNRRKGVEVSRIQQVISINFIRLLPELISVKGVTYKNIIVIIDRLTKYTIFILLSRRYDAPYLVRIFIRDIITKYSIPERIILDKDKLFTSYFQ